MQKKCYAVSKKVNTMAATKARHGNKMNKSTARKKHVRPKISQGKKTYIGEAKQEKKRDAVDYSFREKRMTPSCDQLFVSV